MIARIWHGMTKAGDADTYFHYLQETGIPGYEKTPGNRGVYVLRNVAGDRAHFLLITFWESEEDIKKFAGPAIEQARYYPEDKGYLLEMEEFVNHYDVLYGL